MMKLSKTPFLALVSLFLLINIVITALLIRTAPGPKKDYPYKNVVESYWLETNPERQSSLLTSLYPEIQRDFPQLVETHKFYKANKEKNQVSGMQSFSELTLRMFSFHQYVKRKNWLTLTRMSYQGLQHYGSALQRYITEDKLDLSKVIVFNTEMKSLTRQSQLRPEDKKLVLARISSLNSDLNSVEDYVGKKESLNKIKGELNNDLASLSTFSKPFVGLSYLDTITTLPFATTKLLLTQYLISGFIFFMMMSLYRSRNEKKLSALFDDGDQPLAVLNKRGQFKEINNAFKNILPYTKFSLINNMNWQSFEKLASIDFKTPLSEVRGPLVTSGSLTIDEVAENFLIRLTPNKKLKGFVLNLVPENEIQTYQEISDIPVFSPPETKEEVHISYILEDVVTELSNLFQSKQVELSLNLKGDNHVLTGNIEKTHQAFSTFIRDMVLALAPKSKTKNFSLTLEQTLDGITLRADMEDVKLATPILKSNFKFEEEGKTKKRNLNQGIEVLKNSGLGFDIDLNFKNNFDIDNKFTGSNISIEMRQ